MNYILLITYSLLFTLITLYRLNYGLFLLFLLLPTYLIRFNIGPLPTTLMEVMIWIILIVWLIKYNKQIFLSLKSYVISHKNLFIASSLFLLAATISIFTSADLRSALGEWKAFYTEPFLLFLVIITTFQNQIQKRSVPISNFKFQISNYILFPLILCGLSTSILAIYQHFTGWLVPWAFWENGNTFRVTGWYGFPNGVGLFLAPLVPLALYLFIDKLKELKKRILNTECRILGEDTYIPYSIFCIQFITILLFLISAPFAILFAKSTGGLIGMSAGIGILVLFYKKTRWPVLAVSFVGIVSLLSLPSSNTIKQELLMQDRSGQIRLSIYSETVDFLKDHPIAGAGLASYSEKIKTYHTAVNNENIEIFHHPHNIFLAMWVNLGLLGLFAFLWIIVSIFYIQYSIFKKSKKFPILNYFLVSSMIVILVTGLVDTPYIKNDLSLFFWILPALLLSVENKK